jgi:hypothetical protein
MVFSSVHNLLIRRLWERIVFSQLFAITQEKLKSFIILEGEKVSRSAQLLHFYFFPFKLANGNKSIKIVPKYFFSFFVQFTFSFFFSHSLVLFVSSPHAVLCEKRERGQQVKIVCMFSICLPSSSVSHSLTRSLARWKIMVKILIYCVGKNICGHNKPSIIRGEKRREKHKNLNSA